LLLFISLSTQSGNFWIHPRRGNILKETMTDSVSVLWNAAAMTKPQATKANGV